jgi:DivIVA domain-containing protein
MKNTVQVRRGDEMPLTPADVRNKQFSTTRLRPGYDEEEVDAFLDEVEAELDRLIQENEELRAKLAEVMRGGKSAVPALSSPLSDPKPDMMMPEPAMPDRRQPEPVMMGGMPHIEDNMDTAARVLSLAQQTADQAIADARREADETLGRARREADEVLTKARRQAEQITGDARARAESLERDAQERHRQAMGSLVQTREELERRVDDLRAFEREYRSRLKAYLEGQLRDLEAGVTDSGTFPTMGGPATQPSMPAALGAPVGVRNGGQGPSQYGMPEVVPHSGGFRTTEGAPSRDRR